MSIGMWILLGVTLAIAGVLLFALYQLRTLSAKFAEFAVRLDERERSSQNLENRLEQIAEKLRQEQQQQRTQFDEHQFNTLKQLQQSLQSGMGEVRQQVGEALKQYADQVSSRVDQLNTTTRQQLQEISGQVDKRLSEGFEKTNATFNDVLKRLALIDQAQQKITELSNQVVGLQDILSDKRARGAFGEVQLASLVRNVMSEQHFALQVTLSNSTRADCMIYLPPPTGDIAVDAKFPLESYEKLADPQLETQQKRQAEQQFRQDVKKHIQDVAQKYIVPGETADSAMMFLPAEAVFAEIHARHRDLVELAQRYRVWLVSPTTMMAVLTTARSVIKDAATRQQVNEIQTHLTYLSKDFERFRSRMDDLAKHIEKVHQDVNQVHKSSQKITSRFQKIERVELDDEQTADSEELPQS